MTKDSIADTLLGIYNNYFHLISYLNSSIKIISEQREEHGTSNYDIDLELLTVLKNKYAILHKDLHTELVNQDYIPKSKPVNMEFKDYMGTLGNKKPYKNQDKNE